LGLIVTNDLLKIVSPKFVVLSISNGGRFYIELITDKALGVNNFNNGNFP